MITSPLTTCCDTTNDGPTALYPTEYGLTHTLISKCHGKCTCYHTLLMSRDCNLGDRMVRVSDAGVRTLARVVAVGPV
jgi:hypothetical protein